MQPVDALCPSPPAAGGTLPATATAAKPTRHDDAALGRTNWSTDQLFGSRQEVQISHGGSIYRLRITSLGKLILTK